MVNRDSLYDTYVLSLYWSITTIVTVGYGDMIPMNSSERITNILIMLIGCGVFAHSIDSIVNVIKRLNHNEKKKR